jgi:hypothetical protein
METETLKQIDELFTELSASREAYDEWKSQQPNSHLMDQERSAWLSIKDRTHLIDAEALNAWKAREPGLSTNPDVIAARRRIAELQAELITEQNKLKALVESGTPFAQYQNAVLSAEGFIPGFIHRLRKQRVEKVLLDTYGTSNQTKLPRTLTDVAKLHPSVVKLDLLRFHPRLSALRESQITEAVVSRQHDNVIKALGDLRDLIHPTNASK